MAYHPQATGGTPGWNDPPSDLAATKAHPGINRRARPIDPSCQGVVNQPMGYGGQPVYGQPGFNQPGFQPQNQPNYPNPGAPQQPVGYGSQPAFGQPVGYGSQPGFGQPGFQGQPQPNYPTQPAPRPASSNPIPQQPTGYGTQPNFTQPMGYGSQPGFGQPGFQGQPQQNYPNQPMPGANNPNQGAFYGAPNYPNQPVPGSHMRN